MLSGDTPIGTTEYPSRTQVETSGEECEDLPGRELGLGIASRTKAAVVFICRNPAG